jgi:hypothetical protein
MRRNLERLRVSWLRVLDLPDLEMFLELCLEVTLSEFIDSIDSEYSSEGIDNSAWFDFIASQVIVANKVLSWLIHCKGLGQLLPSEEEGKGVSAVIGMMHFSNLNRIVSKVIVNHVGHVVTSHEESQHLPIVVQELLL